LSRRQAAFGRTSRSSRFPAILPYTPGDLMPPPISPTGHLGLSIRSDHSRPCRHFRQPMSPGHTSGICHPRQQTTLGLSIHSGYSRPCRHFRQPMKPGHISGVRHPRQLTAFWPTTRSGHLRQWRPSRNRWSPDKLRAHGPHWSTIGGSQITAARCCHYCRSRQIQRSLSNKTHLSRHDK